MSDHSASPVSPQQQGLWPTASRRDLLRGAAVLGGALAVGGLPTLNARAATLGSATLRTGAAAHPARAALVPADQAVRLWYTSPATEPAIMQEGLPVGNGHLGAMTTGDPANDAFYVTDGTFWQGGANAVDSSGQFPYDATDFGTFGLMAKARLALPAHTASAIEGYQRQLDLSNGFASTSYQFNGASYQRDVYASHPDDVIVVHLTQTGGGSYTGTFTLDGALGEKVAADPVLPHAVSYTGSLATNGLTYGALAVAAATGGSVAVSGASVTFTGCTEVVLLISAGTDYSASAAGYIDTTVDPLAVARATAKKAAAKSGATLLRNHMADYQGLQQAMSVNLGESTAVQRVLTTDARIAARAAQGSAPDPELEAAFLQFGRYLTITGSRTALPTNLQGLWVDNDDPAWMSDYHTDINLEMNYWLPDRAGLSDCFQAFADYCVAQQPSWEKITQELFNDADNGFRNTSGKIAGWTVAISLNPFGGMGWWWHPAGNAWLCNTLFTHYEYTQDAGYLATVYPLLKGACEFWQARLIETTWTDASGVVHTVLVDDHDWSPEHGPTDAVGITYAQELVWQLFANYRTAAAVLGRDGSFAGTVGSLQSQLYLPQVSPVTGWLEEWMTPDNLDTSDITHRHLSPLIGLFPGDRISTEAGPSALITGAENLLTARGMESFGWGLAWRAACWARLKNPANAYQCFVNQLVPSVDNSNGTAINMLDMYSMGSYVVFQIDANYGLPAAMIEMLLHSRPGEIELLPALPAAWAASGSVTGIGARGGFTVDLAWASGLVTSATVHNIGPAAATTTLRFGVWTQQVTVAAGKSVTVRHLPGTFVLVNNHSGLVAADPGSSTGRGTGLVQGRSNGGVAQHWQFVALPGGGYDIVNAYTGYGMNVSGGSSDPGTPVIQWPIQGSTNEQWTVTPAGDGYVTIVNVRSGLVLGVTGASTGQNATLEQQTGTGSTSQQWLLRPV